MSIESDRNPKNRTPAECYVDKREEAGERGGEGAGEREK